MDRLNSAGGSRSAFKGLAWLAGALATCAALAVGAVLAVFAAATVVLIALRFSKSGASTMDSSLTIPKSTSAFVA